MMYTITRSVLLCLALLLAGCADAFLGGTSERSVANDASLERAEIGFQPATIHGEVGGHVVDTVPADRYGPDRKIEVVVAFEVEQDAQGNVTGKFAYEDRAGTRFTALIQRLRFTEEHKTAVFAGPLTVNSERAPRWVFVRVHDGGTPGAGNDRVTYQIDEPYGDGTRSLPNDGGKTVVIERGDVVIEGGTR